MRGAIKGTTSSVSYATSSDRRLKKKHYQYEPYAGKNKRNETGSI